MLCSISLYVRVQFIMDYMFHFFFLILTSDRVPPPPKETVVLNSLTGLVPKRQSNSAEIQTVYVSAGRMPIISKGKIE